LTTLKSNRHYYSVPFRHVGKYVKICYTAENVEIYFEYKRIAIYTRLIAKHQYTTLKEHLPAQHQWVMNWSVDFLLNKLKR
jgi:hypothetical protein